MLLSSCPAGQLPLGTGHRPVSCRAPVKTAVLLGMGLWRGVPWPEPWGAPEPRLGPASELAWVQLRGGGSPPALPSGVRA